MQYYKDEFDKNSVKSTKVIYKDKSRIAKVIGGRFVTEKEAFSRNLWKKDLKIILVFFLLYSFSWKLWKKVNDIIQAKSKRGRRKPKCSVPLQKTYKQVF